MKFWLLSFAFSWTIWFVFADKKRWRELFSLGFIALVYALATDVLMHYYPLWIYDGQMSPLPELANAFGVYPVVTYLFIQWLPKQKNIWVLLAYWFFWTGIAVGIELYHVKTGHMSYPRWWNTYHSYIANWILFWMFYHLHKLFRFERLSS
jgi:hypothetical protein